jgi:hypothetical protein
MKDDKYLPMCRMVDFVRHKLTTDRTWALTALIRIFELQTADEQTAEVTKYRNGVGFSGCDSEILSSIAKQYISRGTVTDRQRELVMRKIRKYAKQIVMMSDIDKLTGIIKKELV